MKRLILAIVFGVSFLGFVACTSGNKESSESSDSTNVESTMPAESESAPSEMAPADSSSMEADTTATGSGM